MRSINLQELNNKKILITGSTGLIGTNLVKYLLEEQVENNYDFKLVLPVRNIEKAKKRFCAYINNECLDIRECELKHYSDIEDSFDYIIHAAGPTSSKYFMNSPVETIQDFILGTMQVLELARRCQVRKMLFLSTMEVYGIPEKGIRVDEKQIGEFLPDKARNSYPISKIQCENLCYAYYSEYQVNTNVLRLTQTFGPGVEYDDGRVFAEFARAVIEERDIVLKTKGETERSYLYTRDAVSAILYTLIYGEPGEIYTAANEDTYCSIAEMAEMVASMSEGKTSVRFELTDAEKLGYASTLYMNLDTSKLQSLGWKPKYNMQEMYQLMIEDLKKNRKN